MKKTSIANIFLKPFKYRAKSLQSESYHTNAFTDINSQQIERIQTTPIRIYESRFRSNYSQLYWNCKHYAYNRVFSLCEPKQLKAAKNTVFGCTADLVTCFFFPFAITEKRMLPLIEMEAFYFLTDDMIGVEESQQGCKDLLNVITGKQAPVKPNERIIDAIHRDIRVDMTEHEYERYVRSMCGFVNEWGKEIENSKQFRSIDDMINSRQQSIGVYCYLYLIPYSLGIDVSPHNENRVLNRMESLIVKHVFLVNDIFSFKKEVARRDVQTPFNCLLYLFDKFNDLDKAVDNIFKLIDDIESEFFRYKIDLLAQYPFSIDLHRYIDAIEYFAGGNLIWSQFAPRYNKYNRYSIKDVLNRDQFSELITEVEKMHACFNENY